MSRIEVQNVFDIAKAIGCNRVDVIALNSNIDLWVDEEGLFKENDVFEVTFQGSIFEVFGHFVLIGHDEKTGESVSLNQAPNIQWRIKKTQN